MTDDMATSRRRRRTNEGGLDAAEASFFDNHRRAHRVFRPGALDSADRFNPFRHIAYVSKKNEDAEAQKKRGELSLSRRSRYAFD